MSAACANTSLRACARYDARGLELGTSKRDKRVYTNANKGDGEPTNMAIIQKCEGERMEEGERVMRGETNITSR